MKCLIIVCTVSHISVPTMEFSAISKVGFEALELSGIFEVAALCAQVFFKNWQLPYNVHFGRYTSSVPAPLRKLSCTLRQLRMKVSFKFLNLADASSPKNKNVISTILLDKKASTSEHHNLQRAGYVARYLTHLFDNSLNTDGLWLQYVPTYVIISHLTTQDQYFGPPGPKPGS